MEFCRWSTRPSWLALFLVLTGPVARAEHTRVTNPSAVSLELFGRGMTYSLGYDRVLSDDLAAGLSFGTAGTQDTAGTDAGVRATLLSAYANYYFTRDQGSVYVTGGATLVANSSEVKGKQSTPGAIEFPNSAILPTFGLGYENRSDSGFLFRLTAYAIFAQKAAPWIGFTFGYAF